MLTRWTAMLVLAFGLVAPYAANATGGSKGTETGQKAATPKSDQQATTGQTSGNAAGSTNAAQSGQDNK